MIAESLTLALGVAVARGIARLWAGGVTAEDLGITAIDAVMAVAPGLRERRRAARQFEQIAEEVADRLAPFIEAEFADLPEGDRESAIVSAAETIDSARLDVAMLSARDLDPLSLESYLRANASPGITVGLGAAGEALYDHLLREACNYIVEIVITLPTFGPAAIRDLLQRNTTIIELVSTVLDRLPPPVAERESDSHFEGEYQRTIARKLDWLELYGIDLDALSKRYALSVAYISLSARQNLEYGEESKGTEEISPPAHAAESPDDYLRVDDALSGRRRIVITGEAGSGKTTLLQWLAVNSARDAFSGPLEDWHDTVPVFLQLRRFVGQELPAPEQFVRSLAPAIADRMPDGWVHRQLESGRAMLLVDGVDELPYDERPDARLWLLELVETFPDARYVVTSRPPAINEGWLEDAAFIEIELQPMTLANIDAFIEHWHAAARQSAPDEDAIAEFLEYETALKGLVRESRQLRNLATSPLLCAMLCALNRERRTQLPRDRLTLYRIALESLLERRDVERKVYADAVTTLGGTEKLILLQELAYWLVLNGQTDLERSLAVEIVGRKLGAMPNVDAGALDVFDHLLTRSGVIREPVEGHIDFIHRTFHEYLAARAAVDANHIPLLIENATSDQWAEVVVMAAGHAQTPQRHQLIRGLLDLGDSESSSRHRLHLLAVACLETSPELGPELIEEVRERLSHLVPPTNMSEARALASAGDLAVPLLAGYGRERVQIAAACVRTLALIGGEEALQALAQYGSDRRVTVGRELVRAWDNFDAAEYAERVLARSPVTYGRMRVVGTELLRGLGYLQNLEGVSLEVSRADALEGAPNLERVDELTINRDRRARELEVLRGWSNLTTLRVQEAVNLVDISALEELGALAHLDLSGAGRLQDLRPLEKLANLTWLRLWRCGSVTSLESLRGLGLKYLDCDNCGSLQEISALGDLAALDTLELSWAERVADWSPLSEAVGLERLHLMGARTFPSLDVLWPLSRLSVLRLTNAREVVDLTPLSAKPLTNLELAFLSQVESLEPLSSLSTLRSLDVRGCTRVTSIAPLLELKKLGTLNLSGCREVRDLDLLRELPETLVVLDPETLERVPTHVREAGRFRVSRFFEPRAAFPTLGSALEE